MIKPILASDISGLNSLSPPDWKMDYEEFLKDFSEEEFFHPFILLENEQVVGTGNVFIKDKVGWLANIIVDKNHRGKGLGYTMTTFLVDFLKAHHCTTQLLLATYLGAQVYKKIGFVKTTEYRCFESLSGKPFLISDEIRSLEEKDVKKIIHLDQEINGENRAHLINKFYHGSAGFFDKNNELIGCYLPNFSRGLVLSKNALVGIELLKLKHMEKGRKSLLPIENKAGIQFFEDHNFSEGQQLSRMVLGKENDWIPENIYSYGGGFCG